MTHIVFVAAVAIAYAGRKKSKYVFITAFVLLFMFAALRYQYGNDYASYYRGYLAIGMGQKSGFEGEVLYVLLNKLSPHFFVLIAITSFLFLWTMYQLIVRNVSKEYRWISLLIFLICPYLFLVNLSALRQCLAMLLFIAAVPYAAKRKPLPYCVLLLTAVLFHKSAVVLFPIYFWATETPVKKKQVFLFTLVIFLLLFVVDLPSLITAVALWFNDNNYLYSVQQDLRNSLRATILTGILLIYILGNLTKLEGKSLVCAKLHMMGLVFGVLAYHVSMLTRIQMYFDIFSVVSIPAILQEHPRLGTVTVYPDNVLKTLWGAVSKYVLPVLVFLIYALRYYSFFTNPMWAPFFEYHTIFSAF